MGLNDAFVFLGGMAAMYGVLLIIAVIRIRRRERYAEKFANSARNDREAAPQGRARSREVIHGADDVRATGVKVKVEETVLAVKNPELKN